MDSRVRSSDLPTQLPSIWSHPPARCRLHVAHTARLAFGTRVEDVRQVRVLLAVAVACAVGRPQPEEREVDPAGASTGSAGFGPGVGLAGGALGRVGRVVGDGVCEGDELDVRAVGEDLGRRYILILILPTVDGNYFVVRTTSAFSVSPSAWTPPGMTLLTKIVW